MLHLLLRGIVSATLIAVIAIPGFAANVSYSGNVYFEGSPLTDGFVIAGTFDPSFDPSTYRTVYHVGGGNIDAAAYNHAVAAGFVHPIGAGVMTDATGFFSGMGQTDVAAGTPLWLFAFRGATTVSLDQVIATSANPTWKVPVQPNGSTQIAATAADTFIFGKSHPNGVETTIVPFPEPGSLSLGAMSAAALAMFDRRRRRGGA